MLKIDIWKTSSKSGPESLPNHTICRWVWCVGEAGLTETARRGIYRLKGSIKVTLKEHKRAPWNSFFNILLQPTSGNSKKGVGQCFCKEKGNDWKKILEGPWTIVLLARGLNVSVFPGYLDYSFKAPFQSLFTVNLPPSVNKWHNLVEFLQSVQRQDHGWVS